MSSHYLAWNDDGVRDRNDYVRDVYGENYCGTGRFGFVEKSEGVESEGVESEEAESEEAAEPELELFSEDSCLQLNENVVRSPPPDMNIVCDPPLNESVTHDLPPHENVVRSPPPDRNVVCSPPPNENVVCGPLKNQRRGKKSLRRVRPLPAVRSRVRANSRMRNVTRTRKRKIKRSIVDHRPCQSSRADSLSKCQMPKNRDGVGHSCSESLKDRAHRRQHHGRRRCMRSRSRSFSSSSESGRENSGHGSPPVGGECSV